MEAPTAREIMLPVVEKLKQLNFGPAGHAPVALAHDIPIADPESAHAEDAD